MKKIVATSCACLAAACATASAEPGRPGALRSADAALAEAFDDGCLPAIAEGLPIARIAKTRGWAVWEDAPATDAGPDDISWLLASTATVSVTGWADGSCMVSAQDGDPERLRADLLEALARAGIAVTPGQLQSAPRNGVRTAYCSAERPPYVLAVTTPGESGDRAAIVATFFRATGTYPSFCSAG